MVEKQHKTSACDIAFWIGAGLYVIGMCLCFPNYRDLGWLRKGKEIPQEWRLNELAANGSPDNIHVTVSEFTLGKDYHISWGKNGWSYVAIPMISPFEAKSDPPTIVKAYSVNNSQKLEAFYLKEQLTGLVDDNERLPKDEMKHLQESFPGKDLSKAIVIAEGLKFPSRGETYVCLATGTSLMFAGLVCIWGAIFYKKLNAGTHSGGSSPKGRPSGPMSSRD